jgi:hypothetical protein
MFAYIQLLTQVMFFVTFAILYFQWQALKQKISKFINNSARVLCASLYVLNFLLDNSKEITKEIVARDEYFVKTYNLSDLSVCNQTRNGRFVTLQRNVTVVM